MSTPFNAASESQFKRAEPLLTVQQLKDRYLFGIDLTDKDGNPIPEETLQYHIISAANFLETKLDIIIFPTKFVERYDYRSIDYNEFNFIQLKKRPLLNTEIIKAKFPNNQTLVEYPKEWYVEEKEASQIQLSPVEGSFSGMIVTQGGSYVPLIYGTRDYWPHLFEITYTAGFCADEIPLIINEMIGMQACIRIFEILGDIMFGPGITNESVALDGASVSKALANSQKYALFSGRITSYKEQMKDYIETVKKYYSGFAAVVG